MFRISNNPDLSIKHQNLMDLTSGPSVPSNESGDHPNITGVMTGDIDRFVEDEKLQSQKIEMRDANRDDDDYEVVMAEEVDDNLIYSKQVSNLSNDHNLLDDAAISYTESGNYTVSLQERSDKKPRKHYLP